MTNQIQPQNDREVKFQEWMAAQAVTNAFRKAKMWKEFSHHVKIAHERMVEWQNS